MGADDDDLRTLRDYVRWGASRLNEAGAFFGHGTDNALDEVLALVLHAVHLDYELSPAYLDCRLTVAERDAIRSLLRRRIDGRVPVPYLTHEARFAGLSFYVDDRVLVPRSPIAELVEAQLAPWVEAERVTQILDLCTGSGCIAVACAHFFPNARVDAVDISEPALEVARINVERHGLDERVRLIRSDLFQALGADDVYDLIVSNPPYVAREEMERLPEEYRHEPALGLEAGEEGLDVVAQILRDAPKHLTPGGIILVEVGLSAEALAERYPEVPFVWLDLERGGEGVFLLSAAQLEEHRDLFASDLSE
jgi:ribosomal protein L3 glutamine methyltransferase